MSAAEISHIQSLQLTHELPKEALLSPEQRESRAFHYIADRLQSPQIVSWHLQRLGHMAVQGEFAIDVQELDDDTWQRLVDPDQPTIAMRHHFTNEIAFCRAAQQLREQGEEAPNTVMLPLRAFTREWETRRGYYTQRGLLIDSAGIVFYGDFPEPLQIHAAPASANTVKTSARFNRKLHHFNPDGIEDTLEDKAETIQLLDTYGLPHAAVLMEPAAAKDVDVETLFVSRKPFVIKPRNGQQGIGVRMIDPSIETSEDIARYIRDGYAGDTELLVEEWIPSIPFTHPNSNANLDWNLRAIVMGGTYVGAYARAGLKGSPINLATVAEAYSLQEAFDNCGLDETERQLLDKRIRELCAATGALKAGFMGLDIIVDENLQPHLIEINGEKAGGLENIMRVGLEEYNWEPAHAAVRSLSRFLHAQGQAKHLNASGGRRSFRLSPRDILGGVEDVQTSEVFGAELKGFADQALQHHYLFTEATHKLVQGFLTNPEDHLQPETKADYFVLRDKMTQLLKAEDRQGVYRLFNEAVAHNPYDISRLEALASFISHNDPETINRYCVLDLQQESDPDAAKALATMYLCMKFQFAELDLMAISHSTRLKLIDAMTVHYQQPLDERETQSVTSVIESAPEAAYLAPISRYSRGMASLTATTQEIIAVQREAFLSECPSDSLLMKTIATMEVDTMAAKDYVSRGIAHLHDDNLAAALADFQEANNAGNELLQHVVETLGHYIIRQVARSKTFEITASETWQLVSSAIWSDEDNLTQLQQHDNPAVELAARVALSAHYLAAGDPFAAQSELRKFYEALITINPKTRYFEAPYEQLSQNISEAVETASYQEETELAD